MSGRDGAPRPGAGRPAGRRGPGASGRPTGDGPTTDAAREVAVRVVARVEDEGAWADRALQAEAARAGLGGRDRALAARLALGTVQRRRTIDHVARTLAGRDPAGLEPALRDPLRLGAYQLLWADRVPDHAAVSTAVALARRRRGPRPAAVVNAVLRRIADGGRPLLAALPEATPAEAALRHSYPDWIAELWFEAYGPPVARALLAAGNEPAETALRVNGLRPGARVRAEAELRSAGVPWHDAPDAPDALVLDAPFDVGGAAAFRAGDVVPMSRAAQRVTGLVGAAPGMRVLDACAAPGGKASALAADLGAGGAGLVCVERHPGRATALERTLARLGAGGVQVVQADAGELPAEHRDFDRILLDAPCSGLGAVGSRPDLRWRRSPADVGRLAVEQARLVEALLPRLAPGGRLVYAVCTLSPLEGGGVARPHAPSRELELRPDLGDGEGFYVAVLGDAPGDATGPPDAEPSGSAPSTARTAGR